MNHCYELIVYRVGCHKPIAHFVANNTRDLAVAKIQLSWKIHAIAKMQLSWKAQTITTEWHYYRDGESITMFEFLCDAVSQMEPI